MEKNQRIMLIGVAVVLLVAVAGFYTIGAVRWPSAKEADVSALESPALREKFNAFLSQFRGDIERNVTEYRVERKVLIEAAGPFNLREPEYVEENYNMAKALITSLRARIDVILGIFRQAETEVSALLANEPEPVRLAITGEWGKLKQDQEKIYIDYFAVEREILAAYEALMGFYYERRGAFDVDADMREIVFKNPEDDAEAKRLQRDIDDLYAKEKAILSAQP